LNFQHYVLPHIADIKDFHHQDQPLVEMGSHEHFALTSLKPWFSWSLPPSQLGLQAWATMHGLVFPILGFFFYLIFFDPKCLCQNWIIFFSLIVASSLLFF
jgi:hypothetical protein